MEPKQFTSERERRHWRSCERRLGDVTRALQHQLLRQERDLVHALIYRNANQHRKHAYYQGLRAVVRAFDRLDATGRKADAAHPGDAAAAIETSWLRLLNWLQRLLRALLYDEPLTPLPAEWGSIPVLCSSKRRPTFEQLDSLLAPVLEVAVEWLARARSRLRLSSKHAWHHLVLRANFLALGMALVAAASRMHAVTERALEGVIQARRHLYLARMERRRTNRRRYACAELDQQDSLQSGTESTRPVKSPIIADHQSAFHRDAGSRAPSQCGDDSAPRHAADPLLERSSASCSLYRKLEHANRGAHPWAAVVSAESGSVGGRHVGHTTSNSAQSELLPRSSSADSLDEIFAAAEAFESRKREQLMRYL
jgi:hypothetical protein